MADRVFSTQEVELLDGTVIELKPLTIKRLRNFMKKMEEWSTSSDQYESMTKLSEAAMICVEKEVPNLVADQDAFEEVLDMDTIYKIIEVCGGVKLNDPEALVAAARVAAEAAGQTA